MPLTDIRLTAWYFLGELCQRNQVLNIVSVSFGCCNKLAQSQQLKTTYSYSLTVLEAQSPKSSCQQGCIPRCSRGESVSCLFQSLVAASILWLMVTLLHSILSPLFFYKTHLSLCYKNMMRFSTSFIYALFYYYFSFAHFKYNLTLFVCFLVS